MALANSFAKTTKGSSGKHTSDNPGISSRDTLSGSSGTSFSEAGIIGLTVGARNSLPDSPPATNPRNSQDTCRPPGPFLRDAGSSGTGCNIICIICIVVGGILVLGLLILPLKCAAGLM
ncbi:hypothetical protein V8E51_005579 [Hyaloscypha variabilis]